MGARVARSPWVGCGDTLLGTSDGSQAFAVQLEPPIGMAYRLMAPDGEPLAGMALTVVPEPPVSSVTLLPHVLPSESMVIRPGMDAVPTLVEDPPEASRAVQPVGSRSHRAGTCWPKAGWDSMTAEAWVVRDFSPRTPAKKAASVLATVTLKRWHGVPSLLEVYRVLAMSVAETGKRKVMV